MIISIDELKICYWEELKYLQETGDLRWVLEIAQQSYSDGLADAGWCDRHGFKYSDKTIPKEWIYE